MMVGHPDQTDPLDAATHINDTGISLRDVFVLRVWHRWKIVLALFEYGPLGRGKPLTGRLALEKFEQTVDLLHSDAAGILIRTK